MSTKIYDAYRFKEPGYHWDKLWEIQDRARENIKANVRAYYLRRVEDIVYTDPEYDKDPESWFGRLMYVHDKTSKAVREQAVSPRRDVFDVECSVTVSPFEGRMYLRVFCDRCSLLVGGALDFIKEHPDIEDYHFQNQADMPEGMTEEAWREREKTWEAIFSGPGDTPRQLTLNICDAQSYYLVSNWYGIGEEHAKTKPKIPSLEELAVRHLNKETRLNQEVCLEPRVEATFEKEFIRGERFTIGLDQNGEWEATCNGVTKWNRNLRDLVGWIKTEHMDAPSRKYMDDFIARHST
jgi:hypothetical protein